jgi:hypothetical protein
MASDVMREIEALRGQIEALTRQIPKGADAPPAVSSGTPSVHESETVEKIKEQLEGFVELLEKQLQEIPAGTAIGIFALGVLLGRLLPR